MISPRFLIFGKNGFSEIGKLLINRGAKVYVFDYRGFTPVQYAIERNKIDFVRFLIKADTIVNLCSRRNSCYDFYPLHSFQFEVFRNCKIASGTWSKCQWWSTIAHRMKSLNEGVVIQNLYAL